MDCSRRDAIGRTIAKITRSSSKCWRMISVANLVHTPSCRGKESLVIPFNTELLSADWSSHTTSCRRLTWSSIARALRSAIYSRRRVDLAECSSESSVSLLIFSEFWDNELYFSSVNKLLTNISHIYESYDCDYISKIDKVGSICSGIWCG